MFTVCVRDHVMIAHSLRGEVFGPAQRLHGATYVVDVEFRRRELDAMASSSISARPATALRAILDRINYRNLDEEPAFAGANTTTERLARYVFDRMREAIDAGRLGAEAEAIESLRVVLHESHVAWAAYEAGLARRKRRRVTAGSFYFVLPGPPETPTGGFVYDRHMLHALRAERPAGRLSGAARQLPRSGR